MKWINEIRNFLEDYSGVHADDPDMDIFKDMGIVGDDFHEMIEKYSEQYDVDMSGYLWYFHTDEEGNNFVGNFIKPPNDRVKRIPVTPKMLSDFIETKKWQVEYPEHVIPKRRTDLLINQVIVIALLVGLIVWGIISFFDK
ncbi:DUF1493 family protein [Brumimicrobium sp.]|uniref:DUF1493 family protein n=1 Tax=Brumimicrobium sp. TaxID=2029867 RepID=UPI003A925783